MASDPLIRLVNLFELLSTTREPLTQEMITELVPGFPAAPAARARAFERAKASLREIGIPVRVVTLPGRSQVGYQIASEDLEFELDLTRQEWAALEAALGCVVFVGQHGRHFETRLGLLYRQTAPILWEMGDLDRLDPQLGLAIAQSRRVRFGYRGRERDVLPYGVLMRWGHAYLVVNEAGQQKSFRIDRIEPPFVLGEVEERAGAIDVRAALPTHPWLLEIDPSVGVELLGSARQLEALGAAIVGDREGNSDETLARGTVEVSNVGALMSDLLMESPPVVPVAPPHIRHRFLDQLNAVLDSLGSGLRTGNPEVERPPSRSRRRERSTRSIEERFVAVRGLLSYLRVNGGSATIAALAEVSGLPPGEVVELLESASLAGLPPYSPDVLLDVVVDEEFDVVEVSLDSGIARPQRIGVVEAMTVLATLESVMSVLDEDIESLQSASEKLGTALRRQLLRSGEVATSESPPEPVAILRRAIANADCAEFDYTDAQGQNTRRHVRALGIFVLTDRWYLFGLSNGDPRHFRLDRMRQVSVVSADACCTDAEVRSALGSIDRLDPLGLRSSGAPSRFHLTARQVPLLEALTLGVFDRLEGGDYLVYSFRNDWLARLLFALGPGSQGVIAPDTMEFMKAHAQAILALLRQEEPSSSGTGE